eukprot:TRINITY_DN2589_c0_g1_i4.p1 TRINITY_DN2589_c0_g1~~TRINITY_DN2589_c0_g1_i4.p1  ORF type:complete len:719 (+),score=145.91 TRINITY_DN2589_c0_g1_i4:66-2222(+)
MMACSCGRKLLVLGCSSAILGFVGIMVGQFKFMDMKTQLFANVHDLMFIDNTHQTSFEGPLGRAVSEQEQFQQWRKPMKKLLSDCVKDGGDRQADCVDGFDLELAIFNVTNAEDVVLLGAQPQVQEVGPIFAKKYFDKFDVDVAHWDQTGIARFRQNISVELDSSRCGTACTDLLKQEVVIPNPAWALVSAQDAELAFGIIVAAQGLAMTVPAAALPSMATSKFGLTNSTEANVFLQTFFFEPNAQLKLASVGMFLKTTMAAAATGGSCRVGAMSLSAPTCMGILTAFQSLIPAAWNGTLSMIGPAYRVGAAAPVFIRVRVEQVLGLNGAGFTDPLTQTAGLNFRTLASVTDPLGAHREVQMSSKFGQTGTGYYKRYGGAAHDCRWDPDCTLTSASPGSCVESSTCKPRKLEGYAGQGLPGNVWDSELGSSDLFKKGSHIDLFYEGSVSKMVSVGERTVAVPEHKGEGGKALRYIDFRLSSLQRRVENCNATAATTVSNSPGFDCNSPGSTVNMAPGLDALPFYLSVPHFKDGLQLAPMQADSSRQNGGSPYLPLSRVNITSCSGNAWCDSLSLEKYSSYLWIEPESGSTIAAVASTQGNVRIAGGPIPSTFHPKLRDALVPVYWQREGVLAPVGLQAKLVTLQNAPSQLELIAVLCFVFGSLLLFSGLNLSLAYAVRRYRERATSTAEVTVISPRPGASSENPTLHGQDLRQEPGKK